MPKSKKVQENKILTFSTNDRFKFKKKKRYGKAKRDPLMPTKARTAYMFFVRDKINEISKQNGNASTTATTKILGKIWTGLQDSEKVKWVNLANEDRERAIREMAAYRENKEESE